MMRICPIFALLSIYWVGPTPLQAQNLAFADVGAHKGEAPGGDFWAAARRRMVDEEVAGAGVTNPRVLKAMQSVPRHES